MGIQNQSVMCIFDDKKNDCSCKYTEFEVFSVIAQISNSKLYLRFLDGELIIRLLRSS